MKKVSEMQYRTTHVGVFAECDEADAVDGLPPREWGDESTPDAWDPCVTFSVVTNAGETIAEGLAAKPTAAEADRLYFRA